MLEAGRGGGRARVFVALSVPEGVRGVLGPYLAACAAEAPGYRWVPAGNLHLTLRFVGGVDPDVLQALRAALAAMRWAPFRLRLGDVGTFGGRTSPRVVWLGLREGADAATALAAAVDAACVDAGLGGADAPFRPHLTLARRPRPGARLSTLPSPPVTPAWAATRLTLYQSRLGRPHATYEPLATYPAAGYGE
jgi:RNA 2',3'-cyclic 3'-phosphodiesterase